jgi:hypothetical protein
VKKNVYGGDLLFTEGGGPFESRGVCILDRGRSVDKVADYVFDTLPLLTDLKRFGIEEAPIFGGPLRSYALQKSHCND